VGSAPFFFAAGRVGRGLGGKIALAFSESGAPEPCVPNAKYIHAKGFGCEKESIDGPQISSRLSADAGHRSTRACDAACKVPT
jgi:hypothetical protein